VRNAAGYRVECSVQLCVRIAVGYYPTEYLPYLANCALGGRGFPSPVPFIGVVSASFLVRLYCVGRRREKGTKNNPDSSGLANVKPLAYGVRNTLITCCPSRDKYGVRSTRRVRDGYWIPCILTVGGYHLIAPRCQRRNANSSTDHLRPSAKNRATYLSLASTEYPILSIPYLFLEMQPTCKL
jgi:hypothetical protein